MSFYYVAPVIGQLTDYLSLFPAIKESDLNIDVEEYRQRLEDFWLHHWPRMWIRGPGKFSVLTWELYFDPMKISSGHGSLSEDMKTLSLDIFHPDFIMWHRTVILETYQLVLYSDTSEKYLMLTSDTSREQTMDWRRTMHES